MIGLNLKNTMFNNFNWVFIRINSILIFSITLLVINGCLSIDWKTVGSLPAIQRELKNGTTVNKLIKKGNNSYTLLHLAIISNDMDSVQLLIEKGADANIKTSNGHTPIFLSTNDSSDLRIAKALIDAGANIRGVNLLLHRVIYNKQPIDNRLEILKLLIDKGADVNAKGFRNETPINLTLRLERAPEIVKLLVKSGADVNTKNEWGETPLHYAAAEKDPQSTNERNAILAVVRLLVENGADMNAKNDQGKTPLDKAIITGISEVACFLVEKGASRDINEKNFQQKPLYIAVKNRKLEMVRCFIEAGENVNIGTIHDNLLSLATGSKQFIYSFDKKLFRLLIDNGLDIKKFGGPALVNLSRWNNLHDDWDARLELFQILFENGADASYHEYNMEVEWNGIKYGTVPNSPLFHVITAWASDIKILQFLIENDAEVTPSLKKMIQYRFTNVSDQDISDWKFAGLKKHEEKIKQALAPIIAEYNNITGELESYHAHLLLEEDYTNITKQWNALMDATRIQSPWFSRRTSVAADILEARQIVSKLKELRKNFDTIFYTSFNQAQTNLAGCTKEFVLIQTDEAKNYSPQHYDFLKEALPELNKLMNQKSISPKADLVNAILQCQEVQNRLRSLVLDMEKSKTQLQGALRDYRNAEIAMKQIPSSKALIYAPKEFSAVQKNLKTVKQTIDAEKILTKEDIMLIEDTSKNSLKMIQQIDHRIHADAFITTSNPEHTHPTGIGDNMPNRRKIALLIGLDNYQYFSHLKNAVNDAHTIAESLRNRYGFDTIELYNEKATRENIYATLRNIVASIKEGDSLLLYYAGHGWEDGILKEGYWIPYDGKKGKLSSYIGNAELHRLIKSMEKAQHVFVVADSCFSGSFLSRSIDDRGISIRHTSDQLKAMEIHSFFRKIDNRKSRLVLTSGALEPVPDGGRQGHSIFGYYFLRALEAPDDNIFTSSELINRVRKVVANNSSQTPLAGELKGGGHENGAMVFISKP